MLTGLIEAMAATTGKNKEVKTTC